ncbi:MAG: hypothetical protein HY271_02080 [Deltaproteobacteria bacterium]|nr:hypothetical protein [Deltaproteobacteria bacterium]
MGVGVGFGQPTQPIGTHWHAGAPVKLVHVLPTGQLPSHVGKVSPHVSVLDTQSQPSSVAVQTSSIEHAPPHVPSALTPHGIAHSAAGPGQQLDAPLNVTHTHACSQVPLTQWSTVHGFPSSQSVSMPHVVPRQRGSQNSFGLRQGAPGPHDSALHCPSTVTKHLPVGGGGGHVPTQNSFGRQG